MQEDPHESQSSAAGTREQLRHQVALLRRQRSNFETFIAKRKLADGSHAGLPSPASASCQPSVSDLLRASQGLTEAELQAEYASLLSSNIDLASKVVDAWIGGGGHVRSAIGARLLRYAQSALRLALQGRFPELRALFEEKLKALLLFTKLRVLGNVVTTYDTLPAWKKGASRGKPRRDGIRIALFHAGGVGDLFKSALAAQVLKERNPAVQIDFFTPHRLAPEVLHMNRHLDFCHVVRRIAEAVPNAYSSGHYSLLVGGTYGFKVLRTSKAASPELEELLRTVPKESFVASIPELCASIYLPLCDNIIGRKISEIEKENWVSFGARSLGSSLPPGAPIFYSPDIAAFDRVEELKRKLGGRPYLTVHDGADGNFLKLAGAARAVKQWPAEYYARCIAQIRNDWKEAAFVQLGSLSEEPIAGVDVDLRGRTSFSEAAAILKNAELHLDGEGGMTHLAHALHTKSIVLFGPTDRGLFAYPQNHNISAGACANCWWINEDWIGRCALGLEVPMCMASITPERVADAVGVALKARHLEGAECELAALELFQPARIESSKELLHALYDSARMPFVAPNNHSKNDHTGVYIHASRNYEYLFCIDEMTRIFGALKGLRVADIGSGRCALGTYIASQGAQVQLFDTDYLWEHGDDLGVETRFMRYFNQVGRAGFGSIFNLPAASAEYDCVTCVSVIGHFKHKEHALSELLRILKPDGLLLITYDLAAESKSHDFDDPYRVQIPNRTGLSNLFEPLLGLRLGLEEQQVLKSCGEIQAYGIKGIPNGMTVGGIALRKKPS